MLNFVVLNTFLSLSILLLFMTAVSAETNIEVGEQTSEQINSVANKHVDQVLQQQGSLPTYVARFGRKQPVIAVVAENNYTELTDYVVPYSVLAESGVADVFALATQLKPVRLFPALTIQPQGSVESFDADFPEGADYVVVPAVHYVDDPVLLGWIKSQAQKGAVIVGICDGVWVLANADLLKNRQAVGHWFSFEKLQKQFPETQWIKNKRYIADANVISTTGVSASIPVSLALVEAIAGTQHAKNFAQQLGVESWSAEHESDLFQLNTQHMLTASKNGLAFWQREKIAITIENNVDAIALALAADAYARTYRTSVLSLASDGEMVRSRQGLLFLPDETVDTEKKHWRKINLAESHLSSSMPSLKALDIALENIEQWYGFNTAAFVALQLEYPWEKN